MLTSCHKEKGVPLRLKIEIQKKIKLFHKLNLGCHILNLMAERTVNRTHICTYIQTHREHARHRDGIVENILKYIYIERVVIPLMSEEEGKYPKF